MFSVMKRQDPVMMNRDSRDLSMREAWDRGERMNKSAVTALTFCHNDSCEMGAENLKRLFIKEIRRVGYDLPVLDTKTICDGTCPRGPYIGLLGAGLFYWGVKPSEVSELLHVTLFKNNYYFPRIALDPLKSTDARVIFDYKARVMVAQDPDTCMLGLAKYLFDFHAAESCGKCTPCRLGCFQVTEIMKKLSESTATSEDLAHLESLIWLMNQGAYCQFAPKVSSSIALALENFRDDFEAHLDGGSCAGSLCGEWGV